MNGPPADGRVTFALVDVFTDQPLRGNPLAVIDLSDWPHPVEESWYPAVARELNQSETTFVLAGTHGATRVLRSFTAGGVEVFGAGHNALGAWWWLLHTGRVTAAGPIIQRIGSRNLPVGTDAGNRIRLRHRPTALGPTTDPALVAAAVSLTPEDVRAEPAPQLVDTGAGHLIALLTNREALDRATLRKDTLVELGRRTGAQGLYLAWLASDHTAHARFFNPGVGLDEDPATGSAAGPLAALLHHHSLLATGQPLTIVQGESMRRPSRIDAVIDADSVVTISGEARLSVTGLLDALPPTA